MFDDEQCYRVLHSRETRFDGWSFVAVTSTGIYCCPSCPAKVPKRANVRFYATAAAAHLAGFRACKRCRPDATPGHPSGTSRPIESLNARFRKAIRHRGHFPNEQSAIKVLLLVATERKPNRSNPSGRINAWKGILNAMTIHYGDRIQAAG